VTAPTSRPAARRLAGETTAAYLTECARPGSPLRTAAAALPLAPQLRRTIGTRLFPRPLFVDRDELARFAADVLTVFDLIASLPRRLFDDDVMAYCEAVRLYPALLPEALRGYGDAPLLRYGRADMYHDGTAFRLLELNVDSDIGGIDKGGELPRLFRELPAFRAFADGRDVESTEPMAHLARDLLAATAPLTGGRPPVVALIELRPAPPGDADHLSRLSLAGVARRFGLDFRVASAGDVREHDGRLYLDGAPVDVVMRAFGPYDVGTSADGRRLVEPILRVRDRGGVVLWTPMQSLLFGNKACFALLSDPRHHDRFTAEELEVIDRVVPWTRMLDDTTDPATLATFRRDRADLLVKPAFGYGGIGVVPGWERTDEEWAEALTGAAVTGAVVQRRVVPRAEPAVDPETGALEDWHAAWGLFITPGGYAGTYARLLRAGTGTVIGVNANSATHIGGVFTV
jgi:hypothetical protein